MKTIQVNCQQPLVYVGTYHKYNSGSLTGKWIDLEEFSSKDEFLEACSTLHKDEHDPELMFQDYEGIPKAFISESFIDEKFWDYLEIVPEDDREALGIYLENLYGGNIDNNSVDDMYSDFQNSYKGNYSQSNSPELDFATVLFDELYASDILDNIRYYIDYEKFSRDLFINSYREENGYIFSR